MSIGISSSSGDNTGINTGNPQSIGQNSSLQEGSSSLQTPVNPNTVANSSIVIPLSGNTASTTTAPIVATTKTVHHISSEAFIPIGILVVIALGSCIYIYMMSKRPNKYA